MLSLKISFSLTWIIVHSINVLCYLTRCLYSSSSMLIILMQLVKKRFTLLCMYACICMCVCVYHCSWVMNPKVTLHNSQLLCSWVTATNWEENENKIQQFVYFIWLGFWFYCLRKLYCKVSTLQYDTLIKLNFRSVTII